MENAVNFINNIVWGTWGLTTLPVLAILCLLAGLFYTVQTRFVQVRLFSEMIRLLRANKSSERGISSFQALTVSLSGRVGTGNIAGVATAIGLGGPGAVFWMWMVAVLGAATAYIESTLAQIYKEEDEVTKEYRGGPAFYIEKAMGQKWYAWVFSIATIIACGLLLPTVQSNAIGNAVVQTLGSGSVIDTSMGIFSSTKIITGVIIILMLGFIILFCVYLVISGTWEIGKIYTPVLIFLPWASLCVIGLLGIPKWKVWARVATCIAWVPMFFGFPVGTIICIWLLINAVKTVETKDV